MVSVHTFWPNDSDSLKEPSGRWQEVWLLKLEDVPYAVIAKAIARHHAIAVAHSAEYLSRMLIFGVWQYSARLTALQCVALDGDNLYRRAVEIVYDRDLHVFAPFTFFPWS